MSHSKNNSDWGCSERGFLKKEETVHRELPNGELSISSLISIIYIIRMMES